MASQSGGFNNGEGGGGGGGGRDSSGKPKPTTSRMKQPSLIKQLQGILSDYPDGGQIIKELIQNAEDAGASTVKIMYDERCINEESTENKYSKFFKGPALFLYNDATFTDLDWEGIKMIYSSVKEDDKLKVGRFGLGFKSVFHVTDYPSVLSRNNLLLINPHEDNEVNTEFKVNQLNEYDDINQEECLKAFGGRFNISKDTLTGGCFQGTIFRFPLRKGSSALSDNVYTEEKVLDLFKSFKKEASCILLFLKNIASINITIQRGEQQFHEVATVELVENVDEVQNERKRFKHIIEGLGSNYNGQPVESFVRMKVQTTIHTQSQQMKMNTETWLVVNYFMGNNASNQFQKLIQDKSIGYSPYVGVAAPLIQQTDERFEGHEFCFLPLPREGRRQTGLPFHVNGFFALSSNRHHIKWPTDEQKGTRITDKNILWNQCVIREAVPRAYRVLVKNVIDSAKAGKIDGELLVNLFPLTDTTAENWRPFLKQFFDEIKDLSFLKVYKRNDWVTVSDACFATFRGLWQGNSEMRNCIVATLLELNEPFINISSESVDTLNHFYGGIKDMDPSKLSKLLKSDVRGTYKNLPTETKLCVLKYLVSEAADNLFEGLELIPLASGTWETFVKRKRNSKTLLLSLGVYKDMAFPGLEDNFIEIPDSLLQYFRRICDKEKYNVKYQNDEDTVRLLVKLLSKEDNRLTECSKIDMSWLEKVWMHFRSSVDIISHLPLVPLLREGTWEKPVLVELIKLNQVAIFKTSEGHEPLSDGLSNCLEKLSVTVLPSHPRWFPVLETSQFISQPSQHSLHILIGKLVQKYNINGLAEKFNRHCCTPDLINEFCILMTNCKLQDKSLVQFLKKLNIFSETENDQSGQRLVSLQSSNHQMQYIKDITYPIRYPKAYLIAEENNEQLLKRLGASSSRLTDIVKSTLKQLMSGKMSKKYNEEERVGFMNYLIKHFGMFESSQDIMDLARTVKFVKCSHTSTLKMPSEVFDPSENLLKRLLNQDMFPEDTRPDHLVVLKTLGLKCLSDICVDDVKAVAVSLDRDSKRHINNDERATALLEVLNRHPALLDQECKSGNVLQTEIEHLQWVPFVKAPTDLFPKCIPWYTHSYCLCTPQEACNYTEWYKVIGSTMPTIIGASKNVSKHFGWNNEPPILKVVKQLIVLSNHYNKKYHSEMVLIIKTIYQFLDLHRVESKLALSCKDLILCGDTFVQHASVILEKHHGDVDLKPYFHFMQDEFANECHGLFEYIGCNSEQDINVLIHCLHKINDKCQHENNIGTDITLVNRILEKLEREDEEVISNRSDILIPVTTSEGMIVLKPPSECVYTEDEDLYEEEDKKDYLFVHGSVTESMAKAFGVRTLTSHVLDEAEALDVEEWGQEEPLTTRLNSLLREGYKDGLSVPKELVQNADDAKATTVKILFDERENRENTTRLLNKGMAQCQGPALWFYNDASFTEEDFANIIKLNGATKKNEVGKIGKFGLGFCSVYNLTDVPSFFSNQTFVFFDPHRTYLGEALPGTSSGMKIDLRRQKRELLLRKYRDQFQPFQDLFGCSISEEVNSFNGTLFRFPLRTEHQATVSKIKEVAYTKEEVAKLLRMFMETAGDMMLFTQNIEQIEIHHLGPHGQPGKDEACIFSITQNPRYESILQRKATISEIQVLDISINVNETATRLIADINTSNINCTWIVSWSTGENEAKSLANRKEDRRALPLAAVAVPCDSRGNLQPYPLDQLPAGFHKSGRLFCFLPLPLECGLNMHINAYFDVTSDRRQLLSDSEDDKSTQSHQWNRALMTDVVVSAFLKLLVKIVETSSLESYYKLWPTTKPKFTDEFVMSFYKNIVFSKLKIFKGEGNANMCFSDVLIIDPKLRQDNGIGDFCFNLLQQFPPRQHKKVIDMPASVLQLLIEINKYSENQDSKTKKQHRKKVKSKSTVEDTIICEEELVVTFLQSIDDQFWQDNITTRNKFIVFSLNCNSDKVKDKIRSTNCIPTRPYGRLRKPCELVKNSCSLASLFVEKDERFLTEDVPFTYVTENKIESLGMITSKLPSYLLQDRCSYIAHVAKSCCVCAYEFNIKLLDYLSRHNEETDLETICSGYILPVLNRPEVWNLPWYAETCTNVKVFSSFCQNHASSTRKQLCLGQPKAMFRQESKNNVCCVELVVDENDYKPTFNSIDVLKELGVQQSASLKTVLTQLRIVTSNYMRDTAGNDDMIKSCMMEIYSTLLSTFKSDPSPDEDDIKRGLMSFSNSPVVLIDGELVPPCNVALQLVNVCPPYMYCLPRHYQNRHSTLFQAFGVKEFFMIDDVIRALDMERTEWMDKTCTNINKIIKLLQNLEDSMTREERFYNDLHEHRDKIVAPDENGILRPTSELVVDDDDFQTNQTLHVLHPDIPRGLGERLGVKSKKEKCRANISRGIPFGQKEELVTRLQGLLKAYPCDSGIMKELIQNADDAGATEICFITDFSTHKEDHMFGFKILNQPSLCVYNNSSFTEQDLRGIHNLGRGSKGGDPTKTGQYGVGFNAVYHLTDVPSFMTVGADLPNGGAMCIFDPLCNHIDGVTKQEPGIRSDINGLKSDFPDILSGFHEETLLSNGVGTVFRFPLRQQESDISAEVITEKKMAEIIEELKNDMFEALLFVKNISCIKIMDISSGQLKEQYAVHMQISEKDRLELNSFFTHISQAATANKDDKFKNLQIPCLEVKYKATVSDGQRRPKNWLIVQKFGVNGPVEEETYQQLSEAFSGGSIGLLPVGGVAIPLDDLEGLSETIAGSDEINRAQPTDATYNKKDVRNGRAFCFLPLPVRTGLPVHINGHFALDHEARRDLWKEGYRKRWNDFILNHVVIQAWISGIVNLQKMYVETLTTLCTSWKDMNSLMNLYHCFFPRKQTSGTYWADCVKFFYDMTLKNEHNLFPLVEPRDIKYAPFHISWYPLKSSACQFNGVFNDINSNIKLPLSYASDAALADKRTKARIITKTLKNLGMKLLETPLDIHKTLKSLGFETDISSAEYAMDFLRTYDKEATTCNIGHIDGPINVSNYKTNENLWHVVYFLHFAKGFEQKIDGLPVLLTANGTLRTCSNDNPVFASEFQDLLPSSSEKFLHRSLLVLFPHPPEPLPAGQTGKEKEMPKPVVMKLTVEQFLEELPNSCNKSIYCADRTVSWSEGLLVTPEWICRLFQFLNEQGHLKMQESLQKLDNWSFLPALDQNKHPWLIPIRMFHTLYKKNKTTEEDIVLEKIIVSCLDDGVLSRMNSVAQGYAIKDKLAQCCCTTDHPDRVLKCLMHHKSRLDIPYENAKIVLSYFNRHLKVLKDIETTSLQDDLFSLPMFITVQQTVVSITSGTNVYVLPNVPCQGIDEWAHKEDVVLLQESDLYSDLLKFLELTVKDKWTFYADVLLPSMTKSMPKIHWKDHIEFIMKNKSLCSTNPEQQRLLKLLKNIPFIESKCARDYFNHEDPVFECMLTSDCFLPEEYRTYEWLSFLQKIGLIMEVNDDHFVQYARQIENQYKDNINDDARKKSDILINSLIYRNKKNITNELLERIKNISFLVPFKVTDSIQSYCPQYENATHLVSFSDSSTDKCQRLCWTSMHLIPKWIYERLDKKMVKRLGLYSEPPFNKVISHCRQLCASFKKHLEHEDVSENVTSFVKEQMFIFYDYLNSHVSSVPGQLDHTPFIYIPQERDLVLARSIVIEMRSEEEITPYLYRAPVEYGRYFDLFKKVGSQENITCEKLAHILREVHSKHKTEKVIGSDMGVVAKTLSMFFGILSKLRPKDKKPVIHHLYLPNTNMVLCSSPELWMNDMPAFEGRLKGKRNLNWMLDFKELEVNIPDLVEAVKRLPDDCQPASLKKRVTEEVCLSSITHLEASQIAPYLESFIQSTELLEGLVRLVKYKCENKSLIFEEDTVQNIAANLKKIKCIHVKGLNTLLKLDGTVVDGSQKKKKCHISNGEITTFYFQLKEQSASMTKLVDVDDGLIDLAIGCVEKKASKRLIIGVLNLIDEPEKIKQYLDGKRVPVYNINQAHSFRAFPRPGTYVQDEMLSFLIYNFKPFGSHEYRCVAMGFDDIDDGGSKITTFKYVHIKECISPVSPSDSASTKYLVDCGGNNIILVPMWRIYRFVRQSDAEAFEFGNEPEDEEEFQNGCLQVRRLLIEAWKKESAERDGILERLLRHWCDGLNKSNEYARRVFNYIHEVVLQLEHGEQVSRDITKDTGMFAPDTQGSFIHKLSQSVRQASKVHVARYRKRRSKYRSDSHRSAEEVVQPDIREAKRWLKQATIDFQAACAAAEHLTEVQADNWTCYKCHQACEKAMKAILYSINANKVPNDEASHDLTLIASSLPPEMQQEAQLLMRRLRDQSQLRYPDVVHRDRIPSDIYNKDDATYAIKHTRRVIEFANEAIQ